MSEPLQGPQTCGVVMPQIWLFVQSCDRSWQSPGTHCAALPVPRQICAAPYCVCWVQDRSVVHDSQACVVVLQICLLLTQSAVELQLPVTQAPPTQTWFAP